MNVAYHEIRTADVLRRMAKAVKEHNDYMAAIRDKFEAARPQIEYLAALGDEEAIRALADMEELTAAKLALVPSDREGYLTLAWVSPGQADV